MSGARLKDSGQDGLNMHLLHPRTVRSDPSNGPPKLNKNTAVSGRTANPRPSIRFPDGPLLPGGFILHVPDINRLFFSMLYKQAFHNNTVR